MKRIYRITLKLIGWEIIYSSDSACNIHERAVYAVAPHTSYWDGVLGKIAMECLRMKYITIVTDRLFFWPMRYVLHFINAFSNRRIRDIIKFLKSHDDTNLVICPEGQLAPTDHWPTGFYRIATDLDVPIVPVALNYREKTFVIGAPILVSNSETAVLSQMATFYKWYGYGKNPYRYLSPKSR